MKMKSGLLFHRTYSMNPEKNMKMKDARPQEEIKKKNIFVIEEATSRKDLNKENSQHIETNVFNHSTHCWRMWAKKEVFS